MIINLDKYIKKFYVYEDDDGFVANKNIPEKVKKELEEIDKEYFKYIGVHIIRFES